MSLDRVWKELGESPNSLQTQKQNACTGCFFDSFGVAARICFLEKKLCTHSCFLSLEILQTQFFVWFYFFGEKKEIWKKQLKIDIKKTFSFEFGVSLEILQTRSKLIFVQKNIFIFVFIISLLFWIKGVSLEWVWRFSKLSPNSLEFENINTRKKHIISYHIISIFFCGRKVKLSKFGCEFGFSKLSPSSLQNHFRLEHKPRI